MKNKKQEKEELLSLLQGLDNQQPRKDAEHRAKDSEDVSPEQREIRRDRELLEQCRNEDKGGSKQAFRQLVRQYQDNVYAYAASMVEEDEAAFEITRDTFVQAYKNMNRIEPDISLKVWLFTLTKQHLLKVARKQESWYWQLLPLSLYRRYQQSLTKEQIEEMPQPEKSVCQEIQALLSAYIDDELHPEETERVETHLATCLRCAQEYDDLLEAVDMAPIPEMPPAPANLWPAINAAIEQESLFDRLRTFWGEFTTAFPAPVRQFTPVALCVVVILMGVANYWQRGYIQEQNGYIQQLEDENVRLRSTVRSLDSAGQELTLNRFVILTGAIATEEMPPEAAQYVTELIPEPEKAPKPRFISGTIESLSAEITTYLTTHYGIVIKEENIFHETLNILRITAELPRHSTLMFSLFLQQLGNTSLDSGEASTTIMSIEIYLIDKTIVR